MDSKDSGQKPAPLGVKRDPPLTNYQTGHLPTAIVRPFRSTPRIPRSRAELLAFMVEESARLAARGRGTGTTNQ